MDEMDRLMQQARDEHLLKGDLGRTLLSNYEGHKGLKWDGRANTVGGVGLAILVVLVLLNVPQPIFVVLLVLWLLLTVLLFGNGILHTGRMFSIRYGDAPLPDDPDRPIDGDQTKDWGDVQVGSLLESYLGSGEHDT